MKRRGGDGLLTKILDVPDAFRLGGGALVLLCVLLDLLLCGGRGLVV